MYKLKTRKNANGTYSWTITGPDIVPFWEATEARTPWGARVQGMPYLKEEIRAAEHLAASGWKNWEPTPIALPHLALMPKKYKI
jgi:hypothetical protein